MRRSVVVVLSLTVLAWPIPAHAAPPVNDDFADALALTEPLTAVAQQSTAEATTEVDEPVPSCIDDAEFGASVWYTFTPTAKVFAALETFGSAFDTVVAIYTGSSLATLTELGCTDDVAFAAPAPGDGSRVAVLMQPSTTYRIQISGIEGETGSLLVELVKRRMTPAVVRGDIWYLNTGFDSSGAPPFEYRLGFPMAGTFLGLLFGPHGVSTPATRERHIWVMNDWFDADPFVSLGFGRAVDFPVAGDRNGDGDTDIGVVQGNVWVFDTNLDGIADDDFAYGSSRDIKLMGDWDGDGDATPGVIKGNVWYLNNGTDANADVVFGFGSGGDFPVVGDWDGDGDWTPGVVKGNLWFLNNGTGPNADISFAYGRATDFPLVGDWAGAIL